MAADSFTEVTHQSWFSRISGAIKGIVVGLILFGIAFPLLFWNEGRAVKRYKTLKEGGGEVMSIAADTIDPAHEGKLVHLSGMATTTETLADSGFGVSVNALKLRRKVEMYQWKEKTESKTRKKVGGGTETSTTYNYERAWADRLISSSGFKHPTGHENPGSMAYKSEEWVAGVVTLGAFKLSRSLVDDIGNAAALPVPDGRPLPAALEGRARLHGAGFYVGPDPMSPQIGDLRISFSVVNPATVSVVAKQAGEALTAYLASTGDTIELLQMGTATAAEIIQQAQERNRMTTWILRLVGFILMFVGLTLVLKPLSVLADVLPILGNIVEAGTGLIAFLVASVCASLVIAVAWIVYRPLIGVPLLLLGIALAVVTVMKLKRRTATA